MSYSGGYSEQFAPEGEALSPGAAREMARELTREALSAAAGARRGAPVAVPAYYPPMSHASVAPAALAYPPTAFAPEGYVAPSAPLPASLSPLASAGRVGDFGGHLVPRVVPAKRRRARGFRRFRMAFSRSYDRADHWGYDRGDTGRIFPEHVMIMALMAASVAGAVVQLFSWGGT
jgi:hypothetical protein